MMRSTFCLLSIFILAMGSLLAAANNGMNNNNGQMQMTPQQQGQMQQQQQMMMMQPPDCSQLTPAEQNFANQLKNINNKSIFCSQFTPQQRKKAMQMMGTANASNMSGGMMTADQAVEQVMQSSNMRPGSGSQGRSTGGCPVQ